MYKKNKLITFILSFIPGLGHIYIGFTQRGLYFLIASITDIVLSTFLVFTKIFYYPITLIIFPIIWAISLIDSMSLVDKINQAFLNNSSLEETASTIEIENIKPAIDDDNLLPLALSIIPGAGHMYLGFMNKGSELMTLFFLAFYLSDLTDISLFVTFLPSIWLYSLFDILHILNISKNMNNTNLNPAVFTNRYYKFLGFIFIIISMLIILKEILLPVIGTSFGYEVMKFTKVGIICLLLILCGIILMKKANICKK